MQVGRITETDPERLVCIAARNDYRDDGVLDHSYDEIMANADVDETKVEQAARDLGYPQPETVADNAAANGVEELSLELRRAVKTRTLIDHLMHNGHWGPFEHPSTTIAIEDITRTAMAQLTRHRTFTFDVMSLRYVTVDTGDVLEEVDIDGKPFADLFEYPDAFTADEVVSRHGVEEIAIDAETRLNIANQAYAHAAQGYQAFTKNGVPQEEARKLLPMGTKVNMVVSGNARSWMHLLNIRGKANVQGEAREIVNGIMAECKDWMPYTFRTYDEMLPLTLTP